MKVLLLFLCPLTFFGAIDSRGLVFDVRQDQSEKTKIHSRTSDGRRDLTVDRIRILNVGLRYLGAGPDEPAQLRWFFIGKSPVDGRFDYYSMGTSDVVVPRRTKKEFTIVSEPLSQDRYVEIEFLSSINVTAGSLPHGWIVHLYQGDRLVETAASDRGLLAWMRRNPPPRPKRN